VSRRKVPKMGRPSLPKGEAKGALLSVRFAPEERRALEAAAERDGETLSQWARRRLLTAAESDDKKPTEAQP
jgi:hypothetical protein